MTNMKQITIKVAWNNSAFEGLVSSETSYGEMKIVTKDFNDIIDMGEALSLIHISEPTRPSP